MPHADAATAIAERSRHFEAAYAAADADALVDGYFVSDADNPAAYPPGSAPVMGRAALKGMFAGMFAGAPAIRLELVDLVANGAIAMEIGRARLTTGDGGEAIGRYTVCWINTPEGWRAKADFFAEDGWPD